MLFEDGDYVGSLSWVRALQCEARRMWSSEFAFSWMLALLP